MTTRQEKTVDENRVDENRVDENTVEETAAEGEDMIIPAIGTAPPPVRPWESWHLHVGQPGAPATDAVLRAAVGPAVSWCRAHAPAAPWFFVRYWQYGPHVRLRVAGLDASAAAALDRLLGDAMTELLAATPATLTDAEYRRQAAPFAAAGEGGGTLDAGTLWPAGVYRQAYTPEVDRYGGAHLMAGSEALFEVASELALAFCGRRPPEAARSGLGLRAAWAAIETLDADRRARFCRQAADGWGAWAGAGASPAVVLPGGVIGHPPAPVQRWVDHLGRAMSVWQAVLPPARAERILHAHVHMLHNRLGLSVGQERNHYLALTAALAPRAELATVGS